MACLIWKTPKGETRSFTITERETVIGREPGCSILLDDDRASRRHCSILNVEKSYVLQDMGSRNGTRINQEIVSRGVLQDGAKITVGKTILEFVLEEEAVPLTLRTNWQVPDDWSQVEAVVKVSINPQETELLDKKKIAGEIKASGEFESLQQSHDQLEKFYNISSLLTETHNEKEFLAKLLEKAFLIFPAEQGFVFLREKQTGTMKPVAARRLTEKKTEVSAHPRSGKKAKVDPPPTKIAVSHSILEKVMRNKEAVLIRDAGLDDRFSSAKSIHQVQLHSAMCVPFMNKGEVNGVIQLSSFSHKNTFSEDDLRLLTVISNQISMWLENIHLYSQSQQKVSELSSLFEIGKAISSNLNLDKVLDMIMSKSLELIQAESGSIMLIDEIRKELRIKAAVGLNKEIMDSVSWKVGDGIAGWVAQHGQPLLLKNGISDTRFRGIRRTENVKDALSVPLVIGGEFGTSKIIGVLNANNKVGEETFNSSDLNLLSNFATQAAIAIENARLYSTLSNIYLNTVKAFASAVEARDPYTSGHCERLSGYATALGKVFGMTPEQLESLRGASILHDVGKIGIKEEILQKSVTLSIEEYEKVKRHPAIGKQILESIPAMKNILPLIYYHQERFDGTGYPDGLKGDEIPFGARIIAVVDAFDAMTSNRPYRKRIPIQKAIEELRKNTDTQFDPQIVEKFIELVHDKGWGETIDLNK